MATEVWRGTPNEMEKVATRPGTVAAVKWAKDHLRSLEIQARKFDHSAISHINSTIDELNGALTMAVGETRRWSFPYIAVTYVIELRRTSA